MRYPPGYPKTMVHPSHSPAVIGTEYGVGRPARFPPVEVSNVDQEEQYRAQGYAVPGEAVNVVGFYEYPKMLHHPDHKPAIPDEQRAEKDDTGKINITVIKGEPEKFPPVIARSAAEEREWRAKGWGDRAKSDPHAFAKAKASPHDPHRQYHEYPKWVDGKLVQDPSLPAAGPIQYPKWVRNELLQTEEEHRARFPADFEGQPEASDPLAEFSPDEIAAAIAALRQAKTAEQPVKRRPGRSRNSEKQGAAA